MHFCFTHAVSTIIFARIVAFLNVHKRPMGFIITTKLRHALVLVNFEKAFSITSGQRIVLLYSISGVVARKFLGEPMFNLAPPLIGAPYRSSAVGTSNLGGSGGMPTRKFLNSGSLKWHFLHSENAFWEKFYY